MINSIDFAKFMLKTASSLNITLNQTKLQKMIYICDGTLLAYGRNAINENAQAWDYGPVVRSLYSKYKSYEQDIPHRQVKLRLSSEDMEAIDIAMSYYGNMTGSQLITLTHSERPWQEAYEKGRNSEITQQSMKEFYSTIYRYE